MDPVIVQFLHPGSEKRGMEPLASPQIVNEVKYDHVKRWSVEDGHGRKFIVNPVDYYDGEKSVRDTQMRLWCEAEWDSYCRRIGDDNTGLMPLYEHVVRNVPATKARGCLNTDPYVFGDAFKYCCCQQQRQSRPTLMHDLPEGSIILFGSQKTVNGVVGFYLDTVFVVDRKVCEYSKGAEICGRLHGMDADIRKKVSAIYQKRVLEKINEDASQTDDEGCLPVEGSSTVDCLPDDSSAQGGKGLFSLYIGKVFDPKTPERPFSFVPVRPGCPSYARPLLAPFFVNGKPVIQPKMNRGFRKTEVPRNQMNSAWRSLLDALPSEYKYAWHIDE